MLMPTPTAAPGKAQIAPPPSKSSRQAACRDVKFTHPEGPVEPAAPPAVRPPPAAAVVEAESVVVGEAAPAVVPVVAAEAVGVPVHPAEA